jgi:hypothetical protein
MSDRFSRDDAMTVRSSAAGLPAEARPANDANANNTPPLRQEREE